MALVQVTVLIRIADAHSEHAQSYAEGLAQTLREKAGQTGFPGKVESITSKRIRPKD